MAKVETGPEDGIFYGWWILIACCVMFMFGGIMTYASTIYFPAMYEEMGWAYSDLSLIFSMLIWSSIVFSPLAGWLTDKLGCRDSLLIGCAAFLLSGILLSMVHEVWQVVIYWSLLTGFAQAIVMGVTVQSLLLRWFMKRAGMAVSLMYVCSALFQAMMFPLLNRLSVESGFRPVLLVVTIITQLIALLLVLFVMKESPEKMGLNVDGMSDEENSKLMAALGGEIMKERSNTLAEAMKTRQFWLWAVIYGLCAGVLMGLMGNITAIGMSYGYPAATVGTSMTFFMLASVFGRLGAGWLVDKFSKRKLLICATAVTALILLAGYFKVNSPDTINVFYTCLGLFMVSPIVLMFPWIGDLFGRLNMGKIMGVAIGIGTVLVGGFAFLAGEIFKMTDSYGSFFGVCAAAMLLAVILLIFLNPTETQKNNTGGKK